jgi:putative aminopeptidase FrvX
MADPVPFLLSLIAKPGLSGFEVPVRDLIAEKWRPLVDELSTNQLGSLQGLRRAAIKGKRPSLMIAAHMDAIGLMVKKIENGIILITQIGGVDPRILPGQMVTIHGRKEIPGIVQIFPDRLLDAHSAGNSPEFKTLYVDTGLKEREVNKLIQVGDVISFAQSPFEMSGGYIAGHSLDNRASVAALTVCLEELKNYKLDWDLWVVATSKEEIGGTGAVTSTFEIHPDIAIAIDVTFAKGPGANDYRAFPIGKGPTIGLGANIHPFLAQHFVQLAQQMDMPYAIEMMPTSSGTDSMMMQISAEGIPNEVIGIPIRYMHTSTEMVSVNDIQRAGRLLARFITELTPSFLEKLYSEKTS